MATILKTIGNLDQILHVRDEKASGAHGGASSAGNNIRVLNTVVRNTITGASLASNQITLPAGTYTCFASAPCLASNQARARLVNVTDSTVTLLGQTNFTTSGDTTTILCTVVGTFTLTATKVLNLTHYIISARATDGLGTSLSGDGLNEVYAEVYITKIA